jgi:hypothetical protein
MGEKLVHHSLENCKPADAPAQPEALSAALAHAMAAIDRPSIRAAGFYPIVFRASLRSISPRPGPPAVALEIRPRHNRGLLVMRRFFLDALTQRIELLLRDAVDIGCDFHHGHGEKLRGEPQVQLVRERNMLLERARHQLQLGVGWVFHLAHLQRNA